MLHLISHHLCPYAQRAVIVLDEKNVAHERTYIDLANKPAWFLEISPLGKVPVLQSGQSTIFESQVIAEYLDEITQGSLHPEDPIERAHHRSWIAFASETLNRIGAFYSAPADRFDTARQELSQMFARVDQKITAPFFAGTHFHMVDAAWAPVFRYLDVFDTIGDFGLLDGLENTRAWRNKLAARPTVQTAAPSGYPQRLADFLRQRQSHLGTLARACDLMVG